MSTHTYPPSTRLHKRTDPPCTHTTVAPYYQPRRMKHGTFACFFPTYINNTSDTCPVSRANNQSVTYFSYTHSARMPACISSTQTAHLTHIKKRMPPHMPRTCIRTQHNPHAFALRLRLHDPRHSGTRLRHARHKIPRLPARCHATCMRRAHAFVHAPSSTQRRTSVRPSLRARRARVRAGVHVQHAPMSVRIMRRQRHVACACARRSLAVA